MKIIIIIIIVIFGAKVRATGEWLQVINVTTCTTGTCPCNTAKVRGVPWRVSG